MRLRTQARNNGVAAYTPPSVSLCQPLRATPRRLCNTQVHLWRMIAGSCVVLRWRTMRAQPFLSAVISTALFYGIFTAQHGLHRWSASCFLTHLVRVSRVAQPWVTAVIVNQTIDIMRGGGPMYVPRSTTGASARLNEGKCSPTRCQCVSYPVMASTA